VLLSPAPGPYKTGQGGSNGAEVNGVSPNGSKSSVARWLSASLLSMVMTAWSRRPSSCREGFRGCRHPPPVEIL